MTTLVRIAAVSVAGAILYFAGIVNSIVIYEPSPAGAIAVTLSVAVALLLIAAALRGTSEPERRVSALRRDRWLMRGVWAFISLMALVSLAWVYGVPRQRGFDWTPYHNDAIVLNECAAERILAGQSPYASVDLFGCYAARSLGPDRTTPLRRGLFADVPIYPTDDELDAAWALRSRGDGENVEFVFRPSYPAVSFLGIVPWVAAGWDTNVFYLLCLGAAMALVLVRAPAALRPWLLSGMLGATSLVAFTVGGSADLLYALPLVAAWLWRERSWSAVLYGVAAATKQIAWFFAPFLFLQWVTQHGLRAAIRRAAVSAAAFVALDLPLLLPDPAAWVAGVLTPVTEPMFPRGAGLVFLGTNGVGPLLPNAAFLALELAAFAVALSIAWRERERSPELGVALAVMPLYFAHRSLFSYFFLVPLFAFAGLARMRAGAWAPERLQQAGALTLFSIPGPGSTASSPAPSRPAARSGKALPSLGDR